jgi:MFS family permease
LAGSFFLVLASPVGAMKSSRRFTSVAAAGITFQAGSAAVDSATIMSALVFQLTGSSVLVGAVTAILRFGWLFPQLIVGFFAQRSGRSMPFYVVGAFGRALCMALLAMVMFVGAQWSTLYLSIAVMGLWTAYAFVSGIVAVPYNDIVARAVPSELRSRLLATRFFGGWVLALGVVAIADRLVGNLAFPLSYAGIIAMASALMFLSSVVFSAMGEPPAKPNRARPPGFFQYLRDGIVVFRSDEKFRMFVYAQWCGGAVLMAMPFYVVQASVAGFQLERVALLLGAQTVGALASNALWGWWGDRLGKLSLLKAIAMARIFPPMAVLILGLGLALDGAQLLGFYVVIFFVTGALANGLTIAVIGFLMEISPDDRRPAYSGYFNAITAPAFLLPLLAGIIATFFRLLVVFALSTVAAVLQFGILTRASARP